MKSREQLKQLKI